MDISEPTAPGDTKPGEDPTQYVSVKTNRGPLPKGRWWEVCLMIYFIIYFLERAQLSYYVRL